MITPSERIAFISGEHQVSYNEMLRHISHFAETTPTDGAKSIILSENREGWLYALYAIWSVRGIAVPVDAASTSQDIAYILRDCAPRAVWTSAEKVPTVQAAIDEAEIDVQINIIDEIEQADVSCKPLATIAYDEQATCLICYTSGTTGSPKGVMLSYRNVMANVNAVWKEVPIFDSTLRTIIILPLHHVLPLVGSALAPMVVGCGVAICPSLSATDIMGTMQRGQVGLMIGVPRLWQTLYRGIKGKIDSNAVTRTLYKICDKLQSPTLSRLVFKTVHKKLGGHLKYCVSGGAALDVETARGLTTLGLQLLEGYGMTETAPIISFTRPGDFRPGCVGLAMPSVEVKIVDGELCARGENVMQGYYNRPEETAAIIDSEGYVHTGDLATIDETGHIYITGRKKEIIVLSNGKNVNPTEIEEKLEHYAHYVKEAAVTDAGDTLRAIIVPQDAWAAGLSDVDIQQTIKRQVLDAYNATVVPYKRVLSLTIHHGALPRTRLDKLQRYRLKDLLDQTLSPTTHTASEDQPLDSEACEELTIICRYIADEKHIQVHPDDNIETDLALDSLDKVALQGFIEHTFGITLTTDQLTAWRTPHTIARHIHQHKTRTLVEDIDWHHILTTPAPADATPLPRMSLAAIILTRLARFIFRHAFRLRTNGLHNIPDHGPYILAPNHQSLLDAPLVVAHLSATQLRHTYFYAKRDHVRTPIARFLARRFGVVVMDLDTLRHSITTLSHILAQGHSLVIFPEGTRTRDGHVGDFKKTFAILAAEHHVPIIPVHIDGAYAAWPRTRTLPRLRPISVTYLPPVTPRDNEDYPTLAARVREAITAHTQHA